jgi:hypothetical protein
MKKYIGVIFIIVNFIVFVGVLNFLFNQIKSMNIVLIIIILFGYTLIHFKLSNKILKQLPPN